MWQDDAAAGVELRALRPSDRDELITLQVCTRSALLSGDACPSRVGVVPTCVRIVNDPLVPAERLV